MLGPLVWNMQVSSSLNGFLYRPLYIHGSPLPPPPTKSCCTSVPPLLILYVRRNIPPGQNLLYRCPCEKCNNNFIFFYARAFSMEHASQQFFERISVPSFVHTWESPASPSDQKLLHVRPPSPYFVRTGKYPSWPKTIVQVPPAAALRFVGLSSNCQQFTCL